MPRIDIELTSTGSDGSWTWRAAGAREPRGVLDGAILPAGAAVGDQLKVEADYEVEGITIRSVVPPKEKASRADVLELLPTEPTFEPVIQQRARRERGDRPDRREGDRRPRSDRGDRPPRRDRDGAERPGDGTGRRRHDGRDDRRERGDRGDRGERPDRRDRGEHRERPAGEEQRRHRPHFTPPPEVPQRPKPKRLRAGKQHRNEVLAALPEEQRPVAELAVQGMPAVRQRLREDNARLRAEGKPEMPAASVLKLAEELLPRMRVADWLDRAEAAQRQLEHLDLRDLRSVVAASDDPVVARDESTRELAATLKAALITKQDQEQHLWLADVEAALDVGRIIRALRLSSQPPKAGVPFPGALAERLGGATTASLQPTDGPDRWAAVLEAAAFSPIRTHVVPTAIPAQVNDELRATVKRLAPLLPQIATLFGIEVAPGAPAPKPLRPMPRRRDGADGKPAAHGGPRRGPEPRPDAPPKAEVAAEASKSPAPGPEAGETPTEPAQEAAAEAPAETSHVSEPAPEPELVAEPGPAPAAPPEPELVAEPGPTPAAPPEPELVADPEHAPEPELVAELEPEPELLAESGPGPTPAADAVMEPAAEPAAEAPAETPPEPEPAAEAAPEPEAQPEPEPEAAAETPEPEPEPAAEALEPPPEPEPEPAADAPTEIAPESPVGVDGSPDATLRP